MDIIYTLDNNTQRQLKYQTVGPTSILFLMKQVMSMSYTLIVFYTVYLKMLRWKTIWMAMFLFIDTHYNRFFIHFWQLGLSNLY